jgi:hypothetical protein
MPPNSAQGDRGAGSRNPGELPQHPHVDRLKAQPDQPARKTVVLIGLPGKSDRPGYQRLYLTSKLDFYAEFQVSDMVHAESVAADQSPIAGHEATRVTIARDTTIHYIWATTSQPIDEFDLDVRIGRPGAAMAAIGQATHVATCFGEGSICLTCNGTCDSCHPHQLTCKTCDTCETRCDQATCNTCQTRCNQVTCAGTCDTCQTQCGQATCAGTCDTCRTQCNQLTCETCRTCETQCDQEHTCHRTCITCVHPNCPPPRH